KALDAESLAAFWDKVPSADRLEPRIARAAAQLFIDLGGVPGGPRPLPRGPPGRWGVGPGAPHRPGPGPGRAPAAPHTGRAGARGGPGVAAAVGGAGRGARLGGKGAALPRRGLVDRAGPRRARRARPALRAHGAGRRSEPPLPRGGGSGARRVTRRKRLAV